MSTEKSVNKKQFDQVVLDKIEKEMSKPPPPKEPNCWERTEDDCKKRLLGTGCCLLVVIVFTLILIRENSMSDILDDSTSNPSASPIPTYGTNEQQQVFPPTSSPLPQISASPTSTSTPSSSSTSPIEDDNEDIMSLTLLELIGVMILFCSFIAIALCIYCKCKNTRDRAVRVAPRQIIYDVQK